MFLSRFRTSVLLPLWPLEPFQSGWSRGRKGLWAERVVARALWKAGYGIREHRWVGPGRTDIDLVAASRESLLFAEVKLRAAQDEEPWAEVFEEKRQRYLRAAIGQYLRATEQRQVAFRVDAFLVVPEEEAPRDPRILVIRNVISPSSVPGWRGVRCGERETSPAPIPF